jgi:glycosyltransferase involved in cell wall biosynthesis
MVNHLPLVSVQVPVYNHENYVEACLDSVLADKYPNKELVIMDDGSTDNSPQIVNDWVTKNRYQIDVRFFPRPHRGLTRTLNELITICKGDYLVSLASDDMLIDGGISTRLRYLLNHKKKLAVIGDCIVVDTAGVKVHESAIFDLNGANRNNYLSPKKFKKQIISQWAIPGPVLMVKKEIYSVMGNYYEKTSVEDWDFYLRMVAKNLLGFVDKKVSAYRIHADSACRDVNREIYLRIELIKAAIRNLDLFSGVYKLLLIKRMLINMLAFVKATVFRYDRKGRLSNLINR